MLDSIKAVIFDMDGTLIDSMWLWESIDIDYLARHGHTLPEDLQRVIEGMSFTETAAYFKERFQLEDSIETIIAEWNEMAGAYYRERVTMKDNAMAFLKCLSDKGIKTGIGTSNSPEMVQLIMEKFNLGDHINTYSTSCQVAAGKPSPDIYLKVAADLGVAPEECLVFEDVPAGIMAAKNAGMACCAIYDAASETLDDEKKALADYFIYNYDEMFVYCGA